MAVGAARGSLVTLSAHFDDALDHAVGAGDPDEHLAAMFQRVRAALFAWGEMDDHLLPAKLG